MRLGIHHLWHIACVEHSATYICQNSWQKLCVAVLQEKTALCFIVVLPKTWHISDAALMYMYSNFVTL